MLRKAALAVAGGYAALLGVSKVAYRSVLYPAPRRGLREAPSDGQLVEVETDDGERVQALMLPAAGERTIVFFHGNGETIADSLHLGREMVARGIDFVAVEYRGYGSSPSRKPSEQGLYSDAEAVLRWLHQQGTPRSSIMLWGRSLGSGVAVEMAIRGHGGRLLLSAPFTSIPDVATRVAPFLPMRMLLDDRFDSLAKARHLKMPTLIYHGDQDRVVPYDMGVTMSQAIAGSELMTVVGAGHNDMYQRDGERLIEAAASHATQ
jgi:pimeloyl-ACP methyl ester carboxylesterase